MALPGHVTEFLLFFLPVDRNSFTLDSNKLNLTYETIHWILIHFYAVASIARSGSII